LLADDLGSRMQAGQGSIAGFIRKATGRRLAVWGLLLDASQMGVPGALRLMTQPHPVVGALAPFSTFSASSRGSDGVKMLDPVS
jgi:hypothetical protein